MASASRAALGFLALEPRALKRKTAEERPERPTASLGQEADTPWLNADDTLRLSPRSARAEGEV